MQHINRMDRKKSHYEFKVSSLSNMVSGSGGERYTVGTDLTYGWYRFDIRLEWPVRYLNLFL